MKGSRSSRVATTEAAPDDWGDGSWTVDCICGVTFDDGEEMVNCDECGVWVHTRCSRFIKGEKSFACDKCKSKRRRRLTTVTDAEETEVAQLLVELPTKTLHHQPPKIQLTTTSTHSLRSYPLWTDRPLEDRVHVQGVPGDHAALFPSTPNPNPNPNPFPLLINSQLWKSSGYIPKHFSFRYTEFPCWSDTLDPPPTLLLSLSNPTLLPPRSDIKPNTLLPLSTKRLRQDSRVRPPKKKIKADRLPHKLPSLPTAVNPSPVTTLPPISETRSHKVPSSTHISSAGNLEKPKRNAATLEAKLTPRSSEDTALATSLDKSAIADKTALDHTSQLHKSARTTLKSSPSPDRDATAVTHIKKEGLVLAADESQTTPCPTLTGDMPKSKPLIEDFTNSASKCKNTNCFGNSEAFIPSGSGRHCSNETKSDAHDIPKGVLASESAGINTKSDSFKNPRERVSSPDEECKGSISREGVANASKPLELDGKDSDNGLEAVGTCQFDRIDEVTKRQKKSDSKELAKGAGQTPQPSGAVPPLSHHKMVSAGKSSSTSTAIVFSRSYHSDKNRSGGSQNPNLIGKRLMSSSCVNTKKEHAPVELSKNEDKHDKPMNTLKDNPKPYFDSSLKASQPSRTALKYYASVGKDSLRHSSSKVSSVDSSLVSSSASEPAETRLSEHALPGQNKNVTSGGKQQTENVPQSNVQPSPKSNQSSTGHPTATSYSPAGLSDEELALLLHQELNSSPRVPRVPRVRHAGSLPQLASATAANMLMKRTSTSGGKDKNTFSRRKSRDAHKDGARSSREQDGEASKVDRVPSSPDPLKKADTSTLAEANADSKVKKNREKMSSSAPSPFSTDVILKPSSARITNPEDETGANKNSDLTCRTLPGLIAEIMGTGRRMSYEELCNAVLPHWPNLRKHNGERYAYSSHSQAVLDCLRNRTEWARLVDRGPKTSSGRKKRKVDAEPLSSESEDGEERNLKEGESKNFESNKEEYPKGMRKARKRRRLAPQGRSVKDVQKRRKVEVGSSSDSGTSSNSSEDSVSSQDDSQGSEMDVANTEVSVSPH